MVQPRLSLPLSLQQRVLLLVWRAAFCVVSASPLLRTAEIAATPLPPPPKSPAQLLNTTFADLRGFSYQPYFPDVGGTGVEIWGNPHVFDANAGSFGSDFAHAKLEFPKINVMRLWMSLDGYISNPHGYAPQLAMILEQGKAHGLRFIVTLFNDWQSMPDWGGGVPLLQRGFRTAPGTDKNISQQFLEAIVLPHAQDPAVLMWDVMNEPKPEMREVVDNTAQWLRNEAKVAGWIGVSGACSGLGAEDCLKQWNTHTDVLIIHPYCIGCFDGDRQEQVRSEFSEGLDQAIGYANERALPLIATETCWGALNDADRARSCSFELGELAKRSIGFCPHGLRWSKVADLHDFSGGPVGASGIMYFLEKDLSLRPHHEFFNNF